MEEARAQHPTSPENSDEHHCDSRRCIGVGCLQQQRRRDKGGRYRYTTLHRERDVGARQQCELGCSISSGRLGCSSGELRRGIRGADS